MINTKKSLISKWVIFCLSLIFTLSISAAGYAQTVAQNDDQIVTKSEVKKQNTPQAGSEEEKIKKDIDATSEQQHEKTIVDEERDLMEKALELLDLADGCWKKGDIENSLNYLDKAYALVLDTNGDVEIARQKDDLRLLISKRIVALYSTQNIKTSGIASEIPRLINADVEKEIKSFQTVERDFFIASYQRSVLYSKIIKDALKKAGIPEELFWLPLVESGFKVSALSPARALGLWQFIPSTGYKYGLTRDEWMDERMDISKSTEAAIAYLKELHGMFGDWLTVLAAYNCGEGRVLRVISRQRINYLDHFWDLYRQLPQETARYVPRFLATLHIVKDPEKYGFDLKADSDTSLNYEKVKVNKMMKLSDIASKMEVSEDIINILNAELRYKITPGREYEFKIPKDSLQKFNVVYEDIPETERPSFTYKRSSYLKHRVRSGETVATIAKRYKVPAEVIYDNNRINRAKKLKQGQVIRIPDYRSEVAGSKKKSTVGKAEAPQAAASVKTYKVKRGDSLASIAKKHNTSIAKIKELNHLKKNGVQSGRVLKLPAEQTSSENEQQAEGKEKHTAVKNKAGRSKTDSNKAMTSDDVAQLGTNKHIVTKGESLSSISRKYHIEIARIKEWNDISGDDPLKPGQVLVVKQ